MRHIITVIAVIAMSFTAPDMLLHAKDDNGHTLTALWKTFYTARDNDRPKDETAALDRIKKEALAKGLAWDYYDACREYVGSRSRSNWKLYEEAQEAFENEIESNAAPVAIFCMHDEYRGGDGNDLAFLAKNKARMLKESNPEFYMRDYALMTEKYSEVLTGLFSNDYEYALWSLFSRKGGTYSGIANKARSYFSGKYPLDAFIDYKEITRSENRKELEDPFLEKYRGKAACLLVEEDRIKARFMELSGPGAGSQEDFKLLNARCDSFKAGRASFSGIEKTIAGCCQIPDRVSKILNAKRTGFKIADGKVELYLRNVAEATLIIRKDDEKQATVFERKVNNPIGSYYVTDIVKLDLGSLDDGDYIVTCKAPGAEDTKQDYSKTTLSMSIRQDSAGIGVYVADYLTGEPVPKAGFTLTDRDGKVLSTAAGMALDGYTYLPSDMVRAIENHDGRCMLQASYKDAEGKARRSSRMSVYLRRTYAEKIDENAVHCNFLSDRNAFVPEETIHFKAILYRGHYRYRSCEAGLTVKASLLDPRGKEITSLDLKTDDFGSASGEFKIPGTGNNGMFGIRISLDGNTLYTHRFRVDDFVLPTYSLVWEKDGKEYHPGDNVTVKGVIKSYSGHNIGNADISYSVSKYGEVQSGDIRPEPDGSFSITFVSDKEYPWQCYRVQVKVVDSTGETKEFDRSVYVSRNDSSDAGKKEYCFEQVADEPIAVKVIAGARTTWAVAELFTTGDRLLEKRLVRFEPEGDNPAQTVIRFDYKDSYPDVVSMHVLYFQNGEDYSYSITSRRPDDSWKLPLSFTRFLDTTAPGATYTFTLKTESGVQCAATIFDKSTETIQGNPYRTIAPGLLPAPVIRVSSSNGWDSCYRWSDDMMELMEMNYGIATKSGRIMMKNVAMANGAAMETASMRAPSPDAMADSVEEVVEEEAIPFQLADSAPEGGYIRENFANTIAWEPCLQSDKDGNVTFTFTNADKLSTYFVQIFAHDRDMRNAAVRKEMVVTLPVKIAVVEPQILYDGDRYVCRATLSNSTSSPVSGTVKVEMLDGRDNATAKLLDSGLEKIVVPAKGSASFEKEIDVRDISDLGIRMSFTPDNREQGADGIFLSIPVLQTVQTITEAHSSLLLPGDDRETLIEKLRGQFVNFPGSEAAMREVSILDMLREAVPERVEPKSDNAVALTEALYAGMLADGLKGKPMTIDPDSEILARILKLQTPDGGFAWFSGMESSPVVTCLVLERFHRMGITLGTADAVRYIDEIYFRKEARPWWRGWISQAQYLYVRSLYPSEDFSSKGIDSKFWKEFRKEAKEYLVPARVRGLNGAIFAKARRVETLRNLLSSDDGLRLASKWGIKLAAGARLGKSLAKDMESLSQYAEPHKSGGMYFPNAVMPFRGLLESEAYAHAHLCRLMEESGHTDISDGIRLWLMIQKETQKWDSDPGYLEALHAVYNGSQELLATKVIALKGSVELPFSQVKASGNGFTVERQYFKGGRHISDTETLNVGDRITAVYKIWNGENRSFVKLTAPRNAALKPVDQLSGYHWNCYRNVLKDRTEYWYDSYPEEKTEIREEFYVQQAGSFQSAALEIVCEYADHYRANDAGRPAMSIVR